MSRNVNNRGLSSRVLAYFVEHPNVKVSLRDLMREMDAPEQAIANAVYYNINNDKSGAADCLQVIVKNRVWLWHPAAPLSKRLFEELAVTRSGDILVEDEDGKIYRLVAV